MSCGVCLVCCEGPASSISTPLTLCDVTAPFSSVVTVSTPFSTTLQRKTLHNYTLSVGHITHIGSSASKLGYRVFPVGNKIYFNQDQLLLSTMINSLFRNDFLAVDNLSRDGSGPKRAAPTTREACGHECAAQAYNNH